ncbi:MAG: helicase C-terminal domain-containing protein [Candidatus Heimdallarchaeaceae archaeon]
MSNRRESETEIDDYIFCSKCGKIIPSNANNGICTKCNTPLNQPVVHKRVNTNKVWEEYFPYIEVRPLQNQIIESISEENNNQKHIVIQAANGVGKTIAILAALLPICIKKKKTIVYCCRTHQQMSRVIEELKMIKQLKPISGIALRGRKELCLHPIIQKFALDAANAADICRYLKKENKCKYFSNIAKTDIKTKIEDLTKKQVLDSLEIFEIGKSFEVCPFEISKKVIPNVNVVAASYQHIFNPGVQANFLQNLDSEAIKYKMGEIYDLLDALSLILLDESSSLEINEEMSFNPADFIKKVEKSAGQKIDEQFLKSLDRLADFVKEMQVKQNKAPLSYTSAVVSYLNRLLETKTRDDFAHFILKTESKTGNISSKLLTQSLDPRSITRDILDSVHMSVSLSGTLDPIEAYASLIGLQLENLKSLSLPSPYRKENHVTLVVDKISSKLEDRIPATFLKMLEVITETVESTPKNVGVFCASYVIMRSILETGLERAISKPLFIAHQGMSSRENDKLIQDFKNESRKKGGVLISVLGGRSSEGSDYPGGEMQSVIIVGIPYARPTPTVKASIDYLEKQFPTKGREFGYNIPAITRAAQAAGRPIRSLEDYAVIMLLDYRFARHYYKKHLPVWLKDNLHLVQPEKEILHSKIKQFYQYHGD